MVMNLKILKFNNLLHCDIVFLYIILYIIDTVSYLAAVTSMVVNIIVSSLIKHLFTMCHHFTIV